MNRHPAVSVIITTHNRLETIGRVVGAWLDQPVIEVWLVDGTGGTARAALTKKAIYDERFELFPLWKDHGTRTDYALAHLTDGDIVICADDDCLPLPGLTDDLVCGITDEYADICGIHGRTFSGPSYYNGGTAAWRAKDIGAPVRVDFCGVVFAARRELFDFDTRGMHRNCDDLWFQMKAHPDAVKFVVPTKRFTTLESANHGMFADRGELRAAREAFYGEWYGKNYANRGAYTGSVNPQYGWPHKEDSATHS